MVDALAEKIEIQDKQPQPQLNPPLIQTSPAQREELIGEQQELAVQAARDALLALAKDGLHDIDAIVSLDSRRESLHRIFSSWDTLDDSQKMKGLSSARELFQQRIGDAEAFFAEFGEELLAAVGLPFEAVVEQWKKNTYHPDYKKDYDLAVVKNIKNILLLEETSLGATEALYEKFFIANFGKFPVEVLRHQFEEMDNSNLPYGVVLEAAADYNGTTLEYNSLVTLKNVSDSLKGRFAMRIFEIESRTDLARSFLSCEQRYGNGAGHPDNKIEFLIVDAHSNEDGFQLGKEDDSSGQQVLETVDFLEGEGIQRSIPRFLKENATIILLGCNTAAGDENIAQRISNYGTIVYAHNNGIVGADISADVNEQNEIKFSVTYNEDEDRKALATVYRNGERSRAPAGKRLRVGVGNVINRLGLRWNIPEES